MLSRAMPLLRVATIALAVAILAIAGAFVRFFVLGARSEVPRSEMERAVLAAEEAVRADPETSSARVKLASAYLEQGAKGSAEEQAKIAVRLDPEDPAAHYVLGLVQAARGDDRTAVKTLTKAANTEGQLGPFYQDVWASLSKAQLRLGEEKNALTSIEKAINFGPENAALLYERGQIYEQSKEWADALYDYSLAIQYVPDYEAARDAYDDLAKSHPEAVKEYQKKFVDETERPAEKPAGR